MKEIGLIIVGIILTWAWTELSNYIKSKKIKGNPNTYIYIIRENWGKSLSQLSKQCGLYHSWLEDLVPQDKVSFPFDYRSLSRPSRPNSSGNFYYHVFFENKGSDIENNIMLQLSFNRNDYKIPGIIERIEIPSNNQGTAKRYNGSERVEIGKLPLSSNNISVYDGGMFNSHVVFEIKKLYPNAQPQVIVLTTEEECMIEVKAWSQNSKAIKNIFLFEHIEKPPSPLEELENHSQESTA